MTLDEFLNQDVYARLQHRQSCADIIDVEEHIKKNITNPSYRILLRKIITCNNHTSDAVKHAVHKAIHNVSLYLTDTMKTHSLVFKKPFSELTMNEIENHRRIIEEMQELTQIETRYIELGYMGKRPAVLLSQSCPEFSDSGGSLVSPGKPLVSPGKKKV